MKTNYKAYREIDFNYFFSLDEATGEIYWKNPRANRTKVGDRADNFVTNKGYRKLTIFRKSFYAHIVVWLMLGNDLPDGCVIDHVDRVRSNNRPSNLRLTTSSGNSRNRGVSCKNTSGKKGVTYNKEKRAWVAQLEIEVDGRRKNIFIGSFKNKKHAIHARELAEYLYGFEEDVK